MLYQRGHSTLLRDAAVDDVQESVSLHSSLSDDFFSLEAQRSAGSSYCRMEQEHGKRKAPQAIRKRSQTEVGRGRATRLAREAGAGGQARPRARRLLGRRGRGRCLARMPVPAADWRTSQREHAALERPKGSDSLICQALAGAAWPPGKVGTTTTLKS